MAIFCLAQMNKGADLFWDVFLSCFSVFRVGQTIKPLSDVDGMSNSLSLWIQTNFGGNNPSNSGRVHWSWSRLSKPLT